MAKKEWKKQYYWRTSDITLAIIQESAKTENSGCDFVMYEEIVPTT